MGKITTCLVLPSVPHHIEISQLICSANQLTGFYMMGNKPGEAGSKYFGVNHFMPLISCDAP